jgi:hypothetical protein
MKSTMTPTIASLELLGNTEEGTNTQTEQSGFDIFVLFIRGCMAIACLVILILAIIDAVYYHLTNVWLYVTVSEKLSPELFHERYYPFQAPIALIFNLSIALAGLRRKKRGRLSSLCAPWGIIGDAILFALFLCSYLLPGLGGLQSNRDDSGYTVDAADTSRSSVESATVAVAMA